MTQDSNRIKAFGSLAVFLLLLGSSTILGTPWLYGAPKSEVVINKASYDNGVVDINEADWESLQELHGIGPALAERIIYHRQENGPFRSLEDLNQVRGLGQAKIQKLRGQIRF